MRVPGSKSWRDTNPIAKANKTIYHNGENASHAERVSITITCTNPVAVKLLQVSNSHSTYLYRFISSST